MTTQLEIKQLKLDIIEQETIVKRAEQKLLIDAISRYFAGLVMALGVVTPGGIIAIIIGVLLLISAIYYTRKSKSELEAADKLFFELQAKLLTLT